MCVDLPVTVHSVYSHTYSVTLPPCTDKKENRIFLICKEIQSGAVAKSYMRKGFLIYEEMRKYFPIYISPLVIYDFATAPFWISLNMRKIWFFFISVTCHRPPDSFLTEPQRGSFEDLPSCCSLTPYSEQGHLFGSYSYQSGHLAYFCQYFLHETDTGDRD